MVDMHAWKLCHEPKQPTFIISRRAFQYYRLVLERSATIIPPLGFQAPGRVPFVVFGGRTRFSAISCRRGYPWYAAQISLISSKIAYCGTDPGDV